MIHTYLCDCGAEAVTTGDLPPGWVMVELDEGGVEYAFRCEHCAAPSRS